VGVAEEEEEEDLRELGTSEKKQQKNAQEFFLGFRSRRRFVRIGCKLNARKLWGIVCWRFARVGCKRKNPPTAIDFHGNFLRVWVSKRLQELGISEKKTKKCTGIGCKQKNPLTGIDFHRNFLRVWVLNRL
jgi:hypothetical protein